MPVGAAYHLLYNFWTEDLQTSQQLTGGLKVKLDQARTQGGHHCQWTPLQVSSFVSKSAPSTLTALRARFRDRSRAVRDYMFHRIQGSFNLQRASIWSSQSTQDQARPCGSGTGKPVIDCTEAAHARSGRTGHFGAKRWSQFLFEFNVPLQSLSNETVRDLHGAMMRRRALEATTFSLQNEERKVQSQRFSRRLASIWNGKESVKGTLLPRLIDIIVVQRQRDVGLLRPGRLLLTLSGS